MIFSEVSDISKPNNSIVRKSTEEKNYINYFIDPCKLLRQPPKILYVYVWYFQ